MDAVDVGEPLDSTKPRAMTAEALSATYLPRVLRFAMLVSPRGIDPEDVAQDAMVTALGRLDQFDPSRGSVDAWLWRIVVSRARDAGRVARRTELLLERILAPSDQGLTLEPSPESVVLERLRDQDLIAAVRRLPRRYRTVIALRFGAGLSSPEVAEMLQTTRMAVVKTMRRALDRLRKDLEEPKQ
jgi:RNA polymerase sigma-70 factor (ECF subfamily)